MARLAFILVAPAVIVEGTNPLPRVDLYEIGDHYMKGEAVELSWSRVTDKAGKVSVAFDGYAVISAPSCVKHIDAHARVLSILSKLIDASENLDINDPLQLLTKIEEAGGKQAVWAGEKFVYIRTIKNDQKWYFATSLKEFRVQAPTEKDAKIRISKRITDMMTDQPARAVELASWFGAGKKVTEETGEAPAYLDRSTLVHGINGKKPEAKKKEEKTK